MQPILEAKAYHDLKIYSHTIVGQFKIEELIQHILNVRNQPDYKKNYNILVDLTEAECVDFVPEAERFSRFLSLPSSKTEGYRKCAILTSGPKHVVLVKLVNYHLQKKHSDFFISEFSTEEAAFHWLL